MRKGVIVVFLVLILGLSLYSPENLMSTSIPVVTGNESQFIMSADGDESSESITSFSESLADDTLFYPDGDWQETDPVLASAGAADPTPNGDYTDTWTVGDSDYHVSDTGSPYSAHLYLNFSTTSTGENIGHDVNISLYCKHGAITDPSLNTIDVYDYGSTSWDTVGSLTYNVWTWVNVTVDMTYAVDNKIFVRFSLDVAISSSYIYVDYAEVTFFYPLLVSSNHYAESFADVSDWTTSDTSISTDDDVATITENGASSSGRAYASFSSKDFFEYYYEFRIVSMTATTANLEFYDSAAYNTLKTFTVAGTYKGLISDTDAASMERIGFLVGSEGGNVKPDYLRISPSDEMGWQHDGSTTEGVVDNGNPYYDYYSSSDGDILNLTTVRNNVIAAQPAGDFYIYYDTTATKADLESTYYMFFEMRYLFEVGSAAYVYLYMDGKLESQALIDDEAYHTVRINIANGGGTANAYVRVNIDYTYILNRQRSCLIDWMKFYSIANYTVTQSGTSNDDVLYVDSGTLYSNIDSGTIELNHDPALSVASSSYSVYNLTTSGTAPEYSQYVSAWSSYSDNTRGATSGTVTDIKLRFDSTEILSAIKFIEDGTNPTVIRSNVNPPEPDDDETVTLSSVITDGVEVYSVKYNALVYPAGFSDVDYSATETATNFWTYSFSSGVLPTGYYSFSVTANDGANENGLLTEPEYIDFTVRVSEIRITPITFFGVGDDFSQMQLSFEINKDCSYTIYEASVTASESATGTGSVTEGWNNVAWTKLTVTDAQVNFSVKFETVSLSTWINGSYAVAQVVFDVVLSDKTTDFDTVFIQGEASKAATYQIYDTNNILRGSGTVPEGTFYLNFEMWNKRSLSDHFYAIKFTNNTSTDWLNGSYYAGSPDEFKGGGVQISEKWWADPFTWILIAGGFTLVMILTSGRKEGDLPNAPKDLK